MFFAFTKGAADRGHSDCRLHAGSSSQLERLAPLIINPLAAGSLLRRSILFVHRSPCGTYQKVPSLQQQFHYRTRVVDERRLGGHGIPLHVAKWRTFNLARAIEKCRLELDGILVGHLRHGPLWVLALRCWVVEH